VFDSFITPQEIGSRPAVERYVLAIYHRMAVPRT
jgi:hypothetical protein